MTQPPPSPALAPLSGLRVVECGAGVAAAFAGRLLSLYGAEVTRIEPPGGDPLRRRAPFPADTPTDPGGWSFVLNGGKASVTLDLTTPTGVRLLRRRLTDAAALVEDLPAATRVRAAAAWQGLDHLAVATVSPFGLDHDGQSTTPLPDLVVEAAGGWVYAMGEPAREPLGPAGPLAWMTAGLVAAIAALHGLATRAGPRADVSALEVVTATLIYDTVAHSYTGLERTRSGRRYSHALVTNRTVPCADGFVGLHVSTQRQWLALCDWVGRPDLAGDPRFRTPRARADNGDALDAALLPYFAARTAQDLFHGGQAHRIPVSLIPTPAEVLASPQLAARGFWQELPFPGFPTPVRVPGGPFRIDGAGPTPRAPEHLGASTAPWLAAAGVRQRDLARLAAAGVV